MDPEAEDFIKELEKVTFHQQHHHKVMMAEHQRIHKDLQHQAFLTEAVAEEQEDTEKQSLQ